MLAGGQSLVPMLALRLARFERLVDLNSIAGSRIEREDGALRVGAMVRQPTRNTRRRRHERALAARALPHIGHFQIRNRGTVGGSIAHADPASELPAVASALDAEMEMPGPSSVGPSRRRVLRVMWPTALEHDEMLDRDPVPGVGVRAAASRSRSSHAGVATSPSPASRAVSTLTPHGTIARAAIALFGMGPTPLRANAAESALLGSPAESADLRAVAAVAASATDPSDDIHGTAAFRRRVAAHLTERALARALEEATSV